MAKAWRSFDVNGDETVRVFSSNNPKIKSYFNWSIQVTIKEIDQVLSQMNVKISPEKKAQFEKDLDRYE